MTQCSGYVSCVFPTTTTIAACAALLREIQSLWICWAVEKNTISFGHLFPLEMKRWGLARNVFSM